MLNSKNFARANEYLSLLGFTADGSIHVTRLAWSRGTREIERRSSGTGYRPLSFMPFSRSLVCRVSMASRPTQVTSSTTT